MDGNGISLDTSTFNRLRRLYILALSAVALSIILSQIVVRNFLSDQQDDSSVINVAGRQRMLSQKIAKEALLIGYASNDSGRIALKDTLKATLQLWELSHKALLKGDKTLRVSGTNSLQIVNMFQDIEPFFLYMLNSGKSVVSMLEQNPDISTEQLMPAIRQVIDKEPLFLSAMDAIVNQFDLEAEQKVNRLRQWELLLMVFTLLLLLLEFVFIFKPTAGMVKQVIAKLLLSEQKALNNAREAEVLRIENEKSVQALRVLNAAMDKTLLFARVSLDGTILHMGTKFSKLFKYGKLNKNLKFPELMSADEKERQTLVYTLNAFGRTGWQGEFKADNINGDVVWLEMYWIPVQAKENKNEILIIAFDITEKKEAQFEVESLTKRRFEERMNQQKIISSKIIENQEKEQNRIAKDIHDGIGQMLTGLKYNLESVNLSDSEKAASKIEQLKVLTGKIIQGVRAATFNLTPPELSDYGIVPALTKLTQELSKLTGKTIELINRTGFNSRLENLIEINLYRITQEAINNAIKYADSSYIIVTISHSEHLLSITIDDDGKGFDVNKVKPLKTGVGGMGMTFMNERINYINGRLFLSSSAETGTRITLNIPI